MQLHALGNQSNCVRCVVVYVTCRTLRATATRLLKAADLGVVLIWVGRISLETSLGRTFLRKALYRRFNWDEIEPIYGKPWAESVKKAAEARRTNARARRESE